MGENPYKKTQYDNKFDFELMAEKWNVIGSC